jgi:hypothetical protein
MLHSRTYRCLAIVLGSFLAISCADIADPTGPAAPDFLSVDKKPNNGKKPEDNNKGGKPEPTAAGVPGDSSTGTTTGTSQTPSLSCGSGDSWVVQQPTISTNTVKGVRWNASRTPVELTATGVIGSAGGTLSIPGADFLIYFSEGALPAPTTITVISKESPWVTYDFLPHGLVFAKPVYVLQGIANTTVYNTPAMCTVFGAYLAPGNEIISADDAATANETTLSFTIAKYFQWQAFSSSFTSVWQLNHFSRYILASG